MNPVAIIAITGSVCFAAGVIFHKYVVSEAAAIKQHVTNEAEKIRIDVSTALGKVAKAV